MKKTLIRNDTAKQYRNVRKLLNVCTCSACESIQIDKNYIPTFIDKIGMIIIILIIIMIAGCHNSTPAIAKDIVKVSESQIGKGEIYGNNKGPQVKKYTRGKEVAWCAGFVSWCRYHSGKKRGDYYLSALSYWTSPSFKHVHSPKKGDIIVFKRGNRQGHVGIIEKVEGKKIITIEGNVGRFPSHVRRMNYQLGNIPHLIGFVRL